MTFSQLFISLLVASLTFVAMLVFMWIAGHLFDRVELPFEGEIFLALFFFVFLVVRLPHKYRRRFRRSLTRRWKTILE